jgi:hypothetical protein
MTIVAILLMLSLFLNGVFIVKLIDCKKRLKG